MSKATATCGDYDLPEEAALRRRIETVTEALISLLDYLDGDTDREGGFMGEDPDLEGAENGGDPDLELDNSDMEPECEDEGAQCDDEGAEQGDECGVFSHQYHLNQYIGLPKPRPPRLPGYIVPTGSGRRPL